MNRALLGPLFRFALVGGVVTALAYLAFMGLLRAGMHYLPASMLVWAFGVGLNYLLSRSFTFAGASRPGPREVGTFVAGNLVQLSLGSANYWLMIGVLRFDPSLAFACNLVVTSAFSFVFMRWVVFPAAGRA